LAHRISIIEKLRAQAKAPNSKLQAPKKHQVPSSKTSQRAVCPGICFGGFGVLRFGTSLELGLWCLVFRSAVAHKLGCAECDTCDSFIRLRSKGLTTALSFSVVFVKMFVFSAGYVLALIPLRIERPAS